MINSFVESNGSCQNDICTNYNTHESLLICNKNGKTDSTEVALVVIEHEVCTFYLIFLS